MTIESIRAAALQSLAERGVRQVVRTIGGYVTSMLVAGTGATTLVWFPALGDGASGFGTAMIRLAALIPEITIVAVDPPGYGDSRLEGETPSFAALQPWMSALLETLSGPVIATGNSSGAQLAAELGTLAGPRVRGMVFVAWTDFRFSTPPPIEVLCPDDEVSFERLWTSAWHSPPKLPPRAKTEMLKRFSDAGLRRHAASWHVASFWQALVTQREIPRAFIGGLSDKLVPPEAIEVSATHHAAAVHWIPSAGHFPHREQPVRFVEILGAIVRDYLRERA